MPYPGYPGKMTNITTQTPVQGKTGMASAANKSRKRVKGTGGRVSGPKLGGEGYGQSKSYKMSKKSGKSSGHYY